MALPDFSKLSLRFEQAEEEEATGVKPVKKPPSRRAAMPPLSDRIPCSAISKIRRVIVAEEGMVFNLLTNNCTDFGERIFSHIATCGSTANIVRTPGSCRVKPGVPPTVAIDVDDTENERLTNLFLDTVLKSPIVGFETMYAVVNTFPEMDFEATIIQIRHKHFKPSKRLLDPANIDRYISYKNGHLMVGLILRHKLVTDPEDRTRLTLRETDDYGFVFGAYPDDFRPVDAEGNQQNPVRGKGVLQRAMLKNRLRVAAPDDAFELATGGKKAKKYLTFKVKAYYKHADPATRQLRTNLLNVLRNLVDQPENPYPEQFDNEEYAYESNPQHTARS